MQKCPDEILPAFCCYPYEVVAMRLVCWHFYKVIPKDTYKKLGPDEWGSDFWKFTAVVKPGIVRYILTQRRRWINGVRQAETAVVAPPGMEKSSLGWCEKQIVWYHNSVAIRLELCYGLQYVEPKDKIFYPVAEFKGGWQSASDLAYKLPPHRPPDWDTIIILSHKIEYKGTMTDCFCGLLSALYIFADSDVPCKMFRRKS